MTLPERAHALRFTALPRRLRDTWSQIETAAAWFVLLNVLDAALTYILLRWRPSEEGQHVVESNRIAGWFFDRWGFKGLFGFKLAVVVFVCLIALAISLRNVAMARRLLWLGTMIVMAVVIYSVWLARSIIYG